MLTTSTHTLVLVVWLVASPTAPTLLELKADAAPLWSDDLNTPVTFAMQASAPCNKHMQNEDDQNFCIELSGLWQITEIGYCMEMSFPGCEEFDRCLMFSRR